MRTTNRAIAVPKPMLRVYDAIVSLTDAVCDEHLDSEYKELSRAMAAALCRNGQAPSGRESLEAGLAASSMYLDG